MLSQGTKAPSQKTKGQALLAGRRRALQLVLPASQWPRRGKRDPSSNAEPRPSAARLEPDLVKDADAAGSWDRATQRLVSAATVAFFLLLLPQILKNALNMWHGDYAALAALSWVVNFQHCPLSSDFSGRQYVASETSIYQSRRRMSISNGDF